MCYTQESRSKFESAAAISDEATLLVECKNFLDESSVTQLERTLSLLK
jgi:hypothetical protein